MTTEDISFICIHAISNRLRKDKALKDETILEYCTNNNIPKKKLIELFSYTSPTEDWYNEFDYYNLNSEASDGIYPNIPLLKQIELIMTLDTFGLPYTNKITKYNIHFLRKVYYREICILANKLYFKFLRKKGEAKKDI